MRKAPNSTGLAAPWVTPALQQLVRDRRRALYSIAHAAVEPATSKPCRGKNRRSGNPDRVSFKAKPAG